MRKWLARLFRRLANRLDPPPSPLATVKGGGGHGTPEDEGP
jgi:hypothetical protein